MTSPFTYFLLLNSRGNTVRGRAAKTNQHTKRFNLAPLDQLGTAVRMRPSQEALEWKLRSQSEFTRLLCQQALDCGRSRAPSKDD